MGKITGNPKKDIKVNVHVIINGIPRNADDDISNIIINLPEIRNIKIEKPIKIEIKV
jgi:hypothetical protein